MKQARAKLSRLQRLARVRAMAKHEAAERAGHAEDLFARIVALDARTHTLARRYEVGETCRDGESLRQLGGFAAALRKLGDETTRRIADARGDADARQLELAQAERRRSAVEERAAAVRRALGAPPVNVATAARRSSGTVLD